MRKLSSDSWLGIGIMIFSVVLYFLLIPSEVVKAEGKAGYSLSADFFPRMVAVILGVLGLAQFLQAALPPKRKPLVIRPKLTLKDYVRGGVILLITLGYIYCMVPVGFYVTMGVALFLMLLVLGVRRIAPLLLAPVGTVTGVYMLIEWVLGANIPQGLLF
jgi:hypothetical protein